MNIRFDGRVVLVSGGAQGIGQTMAVTFRDAGARVHVADRNPAVGTFAAEAGLPAHVVDLAQRDAATDLVKRIVEQEGRLDVLALAAGGLAGAAGLTLDRVTDQDWDRVMAANVKTALWLVQAAAPIMTAAGWGRIVIISSGAGLRPSLTGLHAYTSAKHAAIGLTKQLSVGLARGGVTVNSIAPGFILSNPDSQAQWDGWSADRQAQVVAGLHTGRLGTSDDIASAALFLASERAGWITGQVLSVDGGRS